MLLKIINLLKKIKTFATKSVTNQSKPCNQRTCPHDQAAYPSCQYTHPANTLLTLTHDNQFVRKQSFRSYTRFTLSCSSQGVHIIIFFISTCLLFNICTNDKKKRIPCIWNLSNRCAFSKSRTSPKSNDPTKRNQHAHIAPKKRFSHGLTHTHTHYTSNTFAQESEREKHLSFIINQRPDTCHSVRRRRTDKCAPRAYRWKGWGSRDEGFSKLEKCRQTDRKRQGQDTQQETRRHFGQTQRSLH